MELSASACSAAKPANEIVYVSVVIGTSTGTGNNSGLSLLTVPGPCNQIQNPTDIAVNEVTTAASTYAMQQFMAPVTTANEIGSPFSLLEDGGDNQLCGGRE